MPSTSPFTSIPSSTPSFVGLIVSVDVSRPATTALDASEIIELQDVIANAYGVRADDLTTTIEYVTIGTMSVTISDSASPEEALDALTESLASTLGINEDDIQLEIDPVTGEVTYSISTNDHTETTSILDALEEMDDLEIESDLITVTDISPNSEIVAEIAVVVNGDEATPMLQQAENVIDAVLGDEYTLETASNIVYFTNFLEQT